MLNQRPTDEGILIQDEDGEHLEWEHEKILAQRIYRGGLIKYKIQWRNHKPTWEDAESLDGCWSDLKDWHDAHPDKEVPQFYQDYLDNQASRM